MAIADLIGAVRPPDRTVFNFLLGHLTKRTLESTGGLNEGFESDLKPTQCDNFYTLIEAIKQKIDFSPSASDCLAFALTSAISLKIPGPLLWGHIVGRSSSLKTTIVEIVGAAHDKCFSISEFTSLYSGSTVGGKDNSIVPRLQGRLFIIKDLTPLLQARPEVQNTVFGQLRDIYDGKGEKFFNNGVFHSYIGVRFACITCTTRAIRKFVRTDMGERFLMCEIDSYWTDDGRLHLLPIDTEVEGNAYDTLCDTVTSGLDDASPRIDNHRNLKSLCWGFINHLFEYMADEAHTVAAITATFKADREFKTLLDSLALWVEYARCPKPKNPDQETVRPDPAAPHRTIKQLLKTAIGLSIVLGTTGPSPEVIRIVRKVALDSCVSFSLEIMNYVATHPSIALDQIAARVGIAKPYANEWCAHLTSMGVLKQVLKPNGSGNRGRHSLCFELTPAFRIVADALGLTAKARHGVPAILGTEPTSPSPKKLFGGP